MDRPSQRFLQRLPLAERRPLIGYGGAILLSGGGFALRLAVGHHLPVGYPFLSFFPAVIFAAFFFGRGPGILSAILCGLASWYFFIPPVRSFALLPGVALSLAFYASVVTIDIALVHWMQRANKWLVGERQRSRELAERSELMFRELQHRVSNNLQVVAALLTLQKRDISDESARAALDEAARRLALIGRIHRQLHDPNGAQIGMAPFLEHLARDVIDAAGRPEIACTVDADAAVVMAPDAAIPMALIVAEAVSNAIEHGLTGRDSGRILIRLGRSDDRVVLTVSDDGIGLPPAFDVEGTNSLGLRIATTLARQLGGRFELAGNVHGGAAARLTLPA